MSTNHWWVVVPMKDLRAAKSRMVALGVLRTELVVAMARDTLDAVVGCDRMAGAVVVCERREDADLLTRPGIEALVTGTSGLNAAVQDGIEHVRGLVPDAAIAVLPGDLPYLRGSELAAALRRAEAWERAVIGDRGGWGTTLTTARPRVELHPRYGENSLARHVADGAVRLAFPAWSGLRRDVNVPADLGRGSALGERTAAVFERWLDEERRVSA